jgi:hypothetical protein
VGCAEDIRCETRFPVAYSINPVARIHAEHNPSSNTKGRNSCRPIGNRMECHVSNITLLRNRWNRHVEFYRVAIWKRTPPDVTSFH